MAKLSKPTIPEPPRIYSLGDLCPAFRERVEAIVADLDRVRVFETLRTEERQQYLYGFGREYDDGRGAVTKAQTALRGWHAFGLAVDIVEDDATPWTAPMSFWQSLGLAAEKHGCIWGGRWQTVDLPHVQMGGIPVSPTPDIIALYRGSGVEAVWRKLKLA